MESRMKRSVASCFMSRSRVDSKNPSCTGTVLRQKRDDVLLPREHTSGWSPLRIDLSLPLPCAMAAGVRMGYGCSTMRCTSYRHTTNVAREDGTTTGSTWIWGGESQQAGPIMEFSRVLHRHSRQRWFDFLASRTTHVSTCYEK